MVRRCLGGGVALLFGLAVLVLGMCSCAAFGAGVLVGGVLVQGLELDFPSFSFWFCFFLSVCSSVGFWRLYWWRSLEFSCLTCVSVFSLCSSSVGTVSSAAFTLIFSCSRFDVSILLCCWFCVCQSRMSLFILLRPFFGLIFVS